MCPPWVIWGSRAKFYEDILGKLRVRITARRTAVSLFHTVIDSINMKIIPCENDDKLVILLYCRL